MTQKTKESSSFVTQEQWAEGMDMIKDFFAKLVAGIGVLEQSNKEMKVDIKDIKKDIVEIKGDIVEMKSDIVEMKTDIVDIKSDIVEMKIDIVDMKGDIVEMKKNIEMNTESINLVSKDVQQAQKLEFDIYNHEKRITALEKTR